MCPANEAQHSTPPNSLVLLRSLYLNFRSRMQTVLDFSQPLGRCLKTL
jgi:hypothetical protein